MSNGSFWDDIKAVAIITFALVAFLALTISGMMIAAGRQSQDFAALCNSSGGNHVEYVYRSPLQCWDTKSGRRIFITE